MCHPDLALVEGCYLISDRYGCMSIAASERWMLENHVALADGAIVESKV